MRVALYLPPHVIWFHSLIREIENEIDICGGIHEFQNYPNHRKVVVDNLVGTESDIKNRISEYQKSADLVMVLNSETPVNIHQQCQGLDLDRVELHITGKVNYEPKHMKIFRHENFFACVQLLYARLTSNPLDVLTPHTPKPYYFDALLGLEKPGRTWLSDRIDEQCADKIYKTYYKNRDLLASMSDQHFSWTPGVEVIDTPYATSSTIRYLGVETWISHVIPVEIYDQCAYTLVTETYDENTFSFYTEKTTKPIMAKRLFVMFAGAYYLRNLRELGFKTFDGIIDESYDLEEDHDTRYKMAFDQVLYLCQQDQQTVLDAVKPIVEHNYNLFHSHDWLRDYQQSLQDSLLGKLI